MAEEQTHANGVEKRLLKALLAFTYLSCPGQLSGNGRKPNQAGPCKRSLPQPFWGRHPGAPAAAFKACWELQANAIQNKQTNKPFLVISI